MNYEFYLYFSLFFNLILLTDKLLYFHYKYLSDANKHHWQADAVKDKPIRLRVSFMLMGVLGEYSTTSTKSR